MTKKIVAALLAVALCLCSLTACSQKTGAKVNKVKIAKGVCLYLKAEAKRENPEGTEEELDAVTARKIAEYVAINTKFQEMGLSLTPTQKQKLPQTVSALWEYFGKYYESIGVTKQDITKVETEKAYKDAVMVAYYQEEGGVEPIPEVEMRAFFQENYIAYRSITGYLTTVDDSGKSTPLSETETEVLLSSFNMAAAEINEGGQLDAVARTLSNVSTHSEPRVQCNGTEEAEQDFFQKACQIENNKAAAITSGDYAFVILREDIGGNDGLYYAQYRIDCLKALRGEAFQKIVDSWATGYDVDLK